MLPFSKRPIAQVVACTFFTKTVTKQILMRYQQGRTKLNSDAIQRLSLPVPDVKYGNIKETGRFHISYVSSNILVSN